MQPLSPREPEIRLLSAEWVLPVDGAPIPDGAVAVQGSRLLWVGPRAELPEALRVHRPRVFPRSILLPGWVNAHSHLNLTAALGALQGRAEEFAAWLGRVIELQEQWGPEVQRLAIQAGLDLLMSTGTTTVAHVSTFPPVETFLAHPMRSVIFHEGIGFPASRTESLLSQAADWLDAGEAMIAEAGTGRVSLGIAPHAPYTFSPALARGLCRIAEDRDLPLSVHLAESPAELTFLLTGEGPLRELLERRGAWDPQWRPPGCSPIRYAFDLGLLQRRGAAVHCNYLSEEDLALLQGGSLTPVWSPGCHLFFGHPLHPAGQLAREPGGLALGTDSAASNRGLNMLREVRLAAAAFEGVGMDRWIEAATLSAARALGLEDEIGSLTAGKAADLQVLGILHGDTSDPYRALLDSRLAPRLVMVDGVEVR